MIRYQTVGTVGAGVPLVARLCEDLRETEFEDSVDADQMVSTGGAVVDLYENRIRMVLLG